MCVSEFVCVLKQNIGLGLEFANQLTLVIYPGLTPRLWIYKGMVVNPPSFVKT